MDCMQCNKPIEASKSNRKRIYCDSKCRMAHNRKLAKLKVQSEQKSKTHKPNSQSEQHGVCKYCGVRLEWDILVCCGPCAWRLPANYDNRIPVLNRNTYTGTMTDYESEHYKPASELGPGEYNPVSKPGDEHYTRVVEAVMARQETG